MKLGMLVRDDNTGLGHQTWEAFNNLNPCKVMVIELGDTRSRLHPERYLDRGAETMFVGAAPTFAEAADFLEGLDIVFICETPYSFELLKIARRMGVKTIVQPNYEMGPWIANPNIVRPDVFGVPTEWHYDEFPEPKILLPVPTEHRHFKYRESSSAKKFLHIVGTPAANDRNGTRDLVDSLQYIQAGIQVTIYCMPKFQGADNYVEVMLRGKKIPPNVRVVLERSSPDNYWQMYPGHDVMIMPRRYGGLCLPVNEALAAGMPVIMPNISPNNSRLPKAWLTDANLNFHFAPGRRGAPIDVYKTDPKLLAAKIEKFANDHKFYQRASEEARTLARKQTWVNLKPLYEQTFQTIISSNGK